MLLNQVAPWDLRDPETRFAVLQDLAEIFSGCARSSWGYGAEHLAASAQRLGVTLPDALIHWYLSVGRVASLTASQNHLRAPETLAIQDNVLCIYDENQGCTSWGIPTDELSRVDPIVVLDRSDELGKQPFVWRREADSVLAFALSVALTELCMSRTARAGELDSGALAALRAALHEVPVQPLRWPQANYQTAFLVDDSLVLMVQGEFAYMCATEPSAPEYVAELAGSSRLSWSVR